MKSRQVLGPYPPLDFAIVGVADWAGDRWVDCFEGEVGKPVWSVRLGHAAGNQLIYVCTAPRRRWDTLMATAGEDHAGAAEFATRWLLPLVDCARPPLDADTNSGYTRHVVAFATQEAAGWADWQPTTWSLDGREAEARVYRFADAWIGMCVVDPERYVAVTAYGASETTLRIATVDGTDYEWDFTKPFFFADLGSPVDERATPASKFMMAEHRRVLTTNAPPIAG